MKRHALALILPLFAALLLSSAVAQNPSPNAAISGQVTLGNGQPAVGYTVIARSTAYVSATPAGEAVTDAHGDYSIPLNTALAPSLFTRPQSPPAPPDTAFTVTVQAGAKQYVEPSEQNVTLTATRTAAHVNFQVTTGPQVTIRVHDALTGQPVAGVIAKYSTNFGNNAYQTAGVTDAQGQIVFRVPQLNFNLSLVAPGGATPTVVAAPSFQFWKQVWQQQARDVVWDVKTYPAVLPAAVPWRGVVLGSNGRPVSNATVTIIQNSGETVLKTDGQGKFSALLPPLNVQGYSYDHGHQDWGVAVQAEKGQQTALLIPTPDETWDGMTLRLTDKPWASFTGTVIGPDGHSEAGVTVSCRGYLSDAATGFTRKEGMTDAQGRFTVPDLPPGTYQVNLGGGPFGPTTIPATDPGYPYAKTLLPLASGQIKDLGRIIVPPADQIVAGQIVTNTGQPASRVTAFVHGNHTNEIASLDEQGRFHVYHIVQEPLMLDIYREDQDGGSSLGQDSPDLFMKVPVQAGQQNVHVVVPESIIPPPPVASVPVPPTGPPQVIATGGLERIDGLGMQYGPQTYSPDPQKTVIHVTLSGPNGIVWQGNLTDMDGMQLAVKKDHGTLTDRTGHTLWAGVLQNPPAYTVISDSSKPHQITIEDTQGRKLWSGPVIATGPSITYDDGYIAAIGPNGRIAWQQPQVPGDVIYLDIQNGKEEGEGWSGNGPTPIDGVIHFSVAAQKRVFQQKNGTIFYSGVLSTLMITLTQGHKTLEPWHNLLLWPSQVFPYNVINLDKYTISDGQGQIIEWIGERPGLSHANHHRVGTFPGSLPSGMRTNVPGRREDSAPHS